jgi:hypothetical protein
MRRRSSRKSSKKDGRQYCTEVGRRRSSRKKGGAALADAEAVARDSFVTRLQGKTGEIMSQTRKAKAMAQDKARELGQIAQGSVASARKMFGGRRHRRR